MRRHRHFEALLRQAEKLPPLVTAVVSPEEPYSLSGALLAAREGVITPILIGDRSRIEAAAREAGEDLRGVEIIPLSSHSAAPTRAVARVGARQSFQIRMLCAECETLGCATNPCRPCRWRSRSSRGCRMNAR